MAAEKAAGTPRRGRQGLPRVAWVLAGGSFVNCLGNFVVPFLVPYLIHRGYGAGLAAGAVSAYAAGKIAAGLAGGLLTDRLGARVTTAGSMAGSAAATLALAAVSGPALILAAAGLTGLVSELYRPATSAILAAGVPGRQRVRAFGVYQLGVSAGTAAGTAIGGLVAEHSFLLLFAGDAATSLAWAIGAWRVLPRTRAAAPPALARPQPQASGPGILRDRQLARLLAVTVLVNLILFQAQTTLPLWVHRQGLPTSSYGLLLALNSGLLMVLQLPATKLTARWRPQAVIAATSVMIGAGFGLLVLARGSTLLAVAVIVWSLGELAQWPVAAAYTTSLAPPAMTGRYAGTRSLCYGAALLLAPLAGTALYSLSPALLWGACTAAGACAAVIMAPRHHARRSVPHRAHSRRPDPHDGQPGEMPGTAAARQPAEMARAGGKA
ncbi:MAG: MFS transporter [Actinobacteria bacterium]|nr:MFS transporter [Actinomycetota bacterium]